MGKPTGFIEFERATNKAIEPKERIKNYCEFHEPLSEEDRKKQAARCMECGVPFCQSGMMIGGMTSGCPLNNLIPEWNDLLYTGNTKQALNRLLKTNNFPEFTSRVCPAPCEAACTCGLNGSPVSIKENEHGIIEYGYEHGFMHPKPPTVRTGKKVAIIGSGPSGLAAADQLNKRGHHVTVFERSDRIGGLLMYGIPNMKLEKEIIERKVSIMKEEGVLFVTNADIGKNYEASQIVNEFDRVILACGASNPRDIDVPGREGTGIYFAVDYLHSVTKGLLDGEESNQEVEEKETLEGSEDLKASPQATTICAKGKRVLVIGGGDTGNDCVGTSIRQGCQSVIQLEMMPKAPEKRQDNNPWPEWPKVCKTDYGQEEAIAVFGKDPRVYESTVKEFVLDEVGTITKAVIVKVKRVFNQELERYVMMDVEGSEYEIEVDMVFIAAGFLGAQSYVAEAFGVDLDPRTNVYTVPGKFQTSQDNIFVTGDMHRGQSLVVWAIREGRDVAKVVDEHLVGYSNLA